MDDAARSAIRAAYLEGATLAETAQAAGVDEADADAYLAWWCDRGCPGAVRDRDGWYRDGQA